MCTGTKVYTTTQTTSLKLTQLLIIVHNAPNMSKISYQHSFPCTPLHPTLPDAKYQRGCINPLYTLRTQFWSYDIINDWTMPKSHSNCLPRVIYICTTHMLLCYIYHTIHSTYIVQRHSHVPTNTHVIHSIGLRLEFPALVFGSINIVHKYSKLVIINNINIAYYIVRHNVPSQRCIPHRSI